MSENKFGVSTYGDRVTILHPPGFLMDKEDALNLAYWLIVMAASPEIEKRLGRLLEEALVT